MARTAILALLLASAPLIAGGRMTPEEITVRAAYAEAVLAAQVHPIVHSSSQQEDPEFSIQIEGVRTGPISELLDKILADEVTVPSGQILQSGTGTGSVDGRHVWTELAIGEWRPAHLVYGTTGVTLNYKVSFRSFFSQVGWTPLSYASFTVLLSAQGQERRYKAMFLFDPDGDEKVRVVDYVFGQSVLPGLMRSSLIQDIKRLPYEMNIRYRSEMPPGVEAGLKKLRALAQTKPGCVDDPVTGLCCDPATGHCGIPDF